MTDALITGEALSAEALLNAAASASAGGVALFLGTARDSSPQRPGVAVLRLEYEAYEPMALREMEAILSECRERFDSERLLLHHRIGTVGLGEPAVAAIAVARHRAAAFDACRYLIEELKSRVPIWKKEVFADGEEWVNARP